MKAQNLKSYLYAISRRDIPIAQQSCQSAHAAIEHAYQYGRPSDYHPSFIALTIKDKTSLEELRDNLNRLDIRTSEFHEPYCDWGLTAIACLLTEDQRQHLSHLNLWKTK